jgi:hypothetical protein
LFLLEDVKDEILKHNVLLNNDVNGATNIYKIAYNAINNKERPNYLSRSKNLSTGLDEPVKPKFTRSAKGKPF